MSSYRKRPIPVQARQLTAESYRSLIDIEQFAAGGEASDGTVFLEIRTLEGVMRASEGDWIVRDNKGRVWPVRADIFAETYEPVPDGETGMEERIARRLAAHDYLVPDEEPDDHWWNSRRPDFREDYLANARRVIALVQAETQPLAPEADCETECGTEAVPGQISLTRDQLAVLLAHHADVLAASLHADARAGLPELRAGVERATELLTLHANALTADGETPAVAELLDSMLSFRVEQPATTPVHVGGRVNAEDCPACSASPSPPPYPFICPGPDVVAYRSRDGRQLRCLAHAPSTNLIGLDWAAVTVLEVDGDARTCTEPECGVDVLADGQPS